MALLPDSLRPRFLLSAPVAVAALTALLVGCTRPAPQPEPIRAVKAVQVGLQALEGGTEYAGEVRARVESRMGFRVAGKLTRRAVEVGQRVQAGQVLAQLDARDYQLASEAARAQALAAQTQRDLAAAELQRSRELRAQNFVSAAELDRREASYKAAHAQWQQAQAQLAAQANQAGYTTLTADAPGVVTGVDAEVGQVVPAGAPVVRIAQDGARDVVFSVPEDRASAMSVGAPVTVRTWAQGAELSGTVREVAASADPVTRTYLVKVSVDAAAAPPLGSTVYARPVLTSERAPVALKLPTSALRQEGAGSAVWVVDTATMTVRSQAVEVAAVDSNDAVIAQGLTAGQWVVTAGVHVLAQGQKVNFYQPEGASAPGPSGGASNTATPNSATTGSASAAQGAR